MEVAPLQQKKCRLFGQNNNFLKFFVNPTLFREPQRGSTGRSNITPFNSDNVNVATAKLCCENEVGAIGIENPEKQRTVLRMRELARRLPDSITCQALL
jgi:hypothetical protein